MKNYKRIDRFLEAAVYSFAKWLAEPKNEWRGKERDCVNRFATQFLLPAIHPDAAISNYSQIRIEGGVPQPAGFIRPSAAKDLVIWRDPIDVAWDSNWLPTKAPWVVMEWKVHRKGKGEIILDKHDQKWLTEFSHQYPDAFGYAITVDFRKTARKVHCTKFRRGLGVPNTTLAKLTLPAACVAARK